MDLEEGGVMEQELAAPVTSEPEVTGETAETAVSQEDNARWKAARERAEREAATKYTAIIEKEKAERERLSAEAERATAALKLFFKGENLTGITDEAIAQSSGKTADDVARERASAEERAAAERKAAEARGTAEAFAVSVAKENDLLRIQKLNPNIKSIDELGDDFVKYRFATDQNGNSLFTVEQAYEESTKRKPALKDKGGKDHLVKTDGGTGGADTTPPAETMELYHRINPKATDAEIIKHWNKERSNK
ncbi:MAG: hypothetical protein RRY54_04360 [Angelakisella sp.]